jgi:hypothetical protein
MLAQSIGLEATVDSLLVRARRGARSVVALSFALGFAFSVAAASPLDASAMPREYCQYDPPSCINTGTNENFSDPAGGIDIIALGG